MKDAYEELTHAVVTGDVEDIKRLIQKALDDGKDVTDVINNGLLKSMHVIGDRFEKNEIYVTELLVSSRGVREGMKVIRPHLLSAGEDIPVRGRILIGTVAGDLHDIGKNLLGLVLEARGFEVIDLGVDVSPSSFVEAVSQYQPDVLCLSALLTTTVSAVGDTIKALSGVKHGTRISVVVGGAALKEDIASAIGAVAIMSSKPCITITGHVISFILSRTSKPLYCVKSPCFVLPISDKTPHNMKSLLSWDVFLPMRHSENSKCEC